jgi:hypothetical protein
MMNITTAELAFETCSVQQELENSPRLKALQVISPMMRSASAHRCNWQHQFQLFGAAKPY